MRAALVLLVALTSIGSADPLKSPEAFAQLRDPTARARALFLEASKVLLHPRCVNCHPNSDAPMQGERPQRHDPPVTRGADDRGVPALRCDSCHQDHNLELARVPGAPRWRLAPRAMAWFNKSPNELCEQLKDRQRNGGRSLAQLVEHVAHDELVAWGWAPGADRAPAPGSAAALAALVDAWRKAGAACPTPELDR